MLDNYLMEMLAADVDPMDLPSPVKNEDEPVCWGGMISERHLGLSSGSTCSVN